VFSLAFIGQPISAAPQMPEQKAFIATRHLPDMWLLKLVSTLALNPE
jgi:hypothetical protein